MSSGLVDRLALVVLAVPVLILAVMACARRPRVIFIGWVVVLAFTPVWVGVSISSYYPLSSIASIAAAVFLLRPGRLRWNNGDWLLAAAAIACLLPLALGGSNQNATFQLLTIWLPGAVLGRVVVGVLPLRWVYSVIAVAFSIVGALAVAEFVFHWNPFIHFPVSSASLYETWGTLQKRGGIVRAEGAFGHSIAMGSSLALAIPLTLASNFRPWIRMAMVGVMMAGAMVSFSRVSILSAVLAVVLSAVVLRDTLPFRWRAFMLAGVVAGAAAAAPFVLGVFTAAGSESTNSAAYRGNLLSLVPDMATVGFSPMGSVSPVGRLYFGRFRSIDSALILTGLTYGQIALIVFTVALLIGVVLVALRRANPATVAVVAQIPAVATVALITQYATFLWFVVGLSVASVAAAGSPRAAERTLDADRHCLPGRDDQVLDERRPAGMAT